MDAAWAEDVVGIRRRCCAVYSDCRAVSLSTPNAFEYAHRGPHRVSTAAMDLRVLWELEAATVARIIAAAPVCAGDVGVGFLVAGVIINQCG